MRRFRALRQVQGKCRLSELMRLWYDQYAQLLRYAADRLRNWLIAY